MLRNNLKYGMEFRYFDIQFDGKRWFVWFNAEISKRQLVDKAIPGAGE